LIEINALKDKPSHSGVPHRQAFGQHSGMEQWNQNGRLSTAGRRADSKADPGIAFYGGTGR